MNPHTGEILGMASRPTFDPNHFAKYSSKEYLNRGVGIIYEPGSVFKPIIGCAGLMEHGNADKKFIVLRVKLQRLCNIH